MDFKIADGIADEYAERIRSGEGREVFEKLVRMCIPYLQNVRGRFGFSAIVSCQDICDELAADAVSDAIINNTSKLPFSYRLQNSFRDLCRQKERALKDKKKESIERLIDKHQQGSSLVRFDSHLPSTDQKIQRKEEKLLVLKALQDHPEFSKKVVFQRLRGSTYSEISQIYTKSPDECKRVFEHDCYHIKKKFSRIQNEEEK